MALSFPSGLLVLLLRLFTSTKLLKQSRWLAFRLCLAALCRKAVVCKHSLKGTWLGQLHADTHPHAHTPHRIKSSSRSAACGMEAPLYLFSFPSPPPGLSHPDRHVDISPSVSQVTQSGVQFPLQTTTSDLHPHPPLRANPPGCQTPITCSNNICTSSIMAYLKVASFQKRWELGPAHERPPGNAPGHLIQDCPSILPLPLLLSLPFPISLSRGVWELRMYTDQRRKLDHIYIQSDSGPVSLVFVAYLKTIGRQGLYPPWTLADKEQAWRERNTRLFCLAVVLPLATWELWLRYK